MGRFTNKVALVTGGTTGIGRATALAFAREGAKVAVVGRREKEGLETIGLIETAGGRAIFLRADVSRADDVKGIVAETVRHFRRLDIAFNNAGIEHVPQPLLDMTEETYDQVIDINVKGVWLSLKHEMSTHAMPHGLISSGFRSSAKLAERLGQFPSMASALGIDPFDPSAVRKIVAAALLSDRPARSCSLPAVRSYHSASRRVSLAGSGTR